MDEAELIYNEYKDNIKAIIIKIPYADIKTEVDIAIGDHKYFVLEDINKILFLFIKKNNRRIHGYI